jgi:hypothetical protein
VGNSIPETPVRGFADPREPGCRKESAAPVSRLSEGYDETIIDR